MHIFCVFTVLLAQCEFQTCHPLSQFRLVVKTALKLLLVFVEYSESNAPLLIEAITSVDTKRGTITRICHSLFGWMVPFSG